MTTYPHEAYVPGVTPTLSDIWREVEKLEATSRYAADVPPIVAEGLVTETRYQGVERAAIELFKVLRQKAEAKLLAQFALGPLRGRATFVTNPDVLGDVGFVDLASTDFLDELGNVILDASVGARIAIGFDLPDPALAAIVRDHLSALGAFGENLRSRVAKWLIDGLNKGMGVEDMVEALPKSSPLSENAARTLARTEAVAAGNASATASWEAAGIGGFKRWLSARDNRVRDDHVDADGQTVPMDQDFEVCGGQRAHYPGDPSLSVDCRINCFPAGTDVGHGIVTGGMRRRYDGSVVRLRLLSGVELAGTPNHPVLTEGGWVPLGQITPGQHLVCAGRGEDRVGGRDPHEQETPTAIDEVVEALARSGDTQRVPRVAVDLHGERPQTDVDVVRPDGQLWLRGPVLGAKPADELGLALADAADRALAAESLAGTELRALRSAPGAMGGGGHPQALLGRRASHAGDHGGSTVTGLDPGLEQPAPHGGPADAVAEGQRLLGLSVAVSLDEVVDVEVEPFHGDVFTLETTSGWYTAGPASVVVRNCRCTVTYRTADGQDLEIPRTRNQLQKVARARGLATSGSNTQLRRRLLNATRQEKLEAGVAPEDLTRRELLERATSAGIRGRAKMSKDQLIDELRRRKAFAVVELPQGHNMAFPVRHDPATGKYLPAGAGVSGSGSQADPYAVDARVPPHYPRGTHPLHFDFTGLARKAQQENTAEDFRGLFEAEYFEDPSIPATNWDLDTVTMRQVRNATKQVRAATTQALEGRGIGGGDSYVRVWRAGDVPDPGKPGSPNGPGDPFPSFSWSPRDLFGEPKPYLVQASDVWGDVDAINPGQSLLESEVILRPGSAVAERAQATVLNGQSFPVRHDPGTGKYLPADGGGGAKKAKKAKKPARAKPAHAKPTSDGSPIKAVGPAKTATRGGGLPFPKEPVNITGPDGKPVMRYDDAGAVPTTSYESSTGEMLGDVSHSDGWTEATRVWRANGRRKPTAAEAKEGYRYGVVTVGPSRPTKAEAEADMYGWLTKGKKAPGFDQPDAGTAAESTDPARQKVTDALSEHYGPWETRNLRTLVGYTDDGHRLMNARLRAGEKDPRAVKLDRALAKAGPLPEAMTVERRTEAPVFAGMKPGTVSRDRAFLSTSADTSGWGPARPGQVTAHIALPKGTRAAYIGDASYAPVEYEVLVGRGSHLRFDRRKGDDVFLTLVKQDPVL